MAEIVLAEIVLAEIVLAEIVFGGDRLGGDRLGGGHVSTGLLRTPLLSTHRGCRTVAIAFPEMKGDLVEGALFPLRSLRRQNALRLESNAARSRHKDSWLRISTSLIITFATPLCEANFRRGD